MRWGIQENKQRLGHKRSCSCIKEDGLYPKGKGPSIAFKLGSNRSSGQNAWSCAEKWKAWRPVRSCCGNPDKR